MALVQPNTSAARPDDSALLDVRQLEVVYNRVALVLQGVSLRVPQGQIVAILGSNGAGKTTTLRAISGFLGADNAAVTDGQVLFRGQDITGQPPFATARRGLGIVPERNKVFATLTVEENLRLGRAARRSGAAQGIDLRALVDALFPVLGERKKQLAGYLSGGERQMLAIGKALLGAPDLLLIDELSLGLAPLVVQHLMELVQRINRELGMTILLVEQNAPAALAIAHSAYILENGRIVLDGTPERLAAHEDVKEFYLGLGAEGDGTAKSYADVKQYRRKRRWWG